MEGDGKAIFDDAKCIIDGVEMLENGGFERFTKQWKFDSKCERAGYELVINQREYTEGKSALEINIANEQYIKLPQIGEVYQIEI